MNIETTAVVSEATSGDRTVVAGETGVVISLIGYLLVADDETEITWKTGTTAKTGAMKVIKGVGNGYRKGKPLFSGAPGEALVLTLGDSVQVSGFVEYRKATAAPAGG